MIKTKISPEDKKYYDLINSLQIEIRLGKNIFDILDHILEEILNIFEASTGSISLADPQEKILTIACAKGIDKEKKIAAKFPFAVGITGAAAAAMQTIYAPDVSKDKRYVKLIDSVASELAVPMSSGEECIGILNLESHYLDHFSKKQILWAEKIADELCKALIQNKFYREAIERSKNEQDFLNSILGYDAQILFLKTRIRTVAPSDASILINGESGTGKELVAKSLHYLSARKSNPFVSINCGALNENLLESELFGHVKGAFTGADRNVIGRFEAANGGTIFLDEVAEMSPSLQVKLLRVLQEGEIERVGDFKKIKVSVRVISATHKDLAQEVEKGNFRLDLYFRLGVIPLRLPPLRERRGDIPLLVHHFLLEFNKRYGKNKHFDIATLDLLTQHTWPGNVRELENAIQYAAILCPNDKITPDFLPDNAIRGYDRLKEEKTSAKKGETSFEDGVQIDYSDLNLEKALSKIETKLIQEALRIGKTQDQAAKLLGISRGSLQYKIKNNPEIQFLSD